ncbi:hypothetical protein A8950_3026 [Dongia mobilis]|uniref:Uncharacterized protein n=1 Tax=Dongia mobilis TaxID=578943 RepID=A0A4R6WJE7_9PROT|nr:hypothetical protein [Dongia mobilis]TDQ80495.1 hypothetical protein A8950_3026 [Dongia mobilis]
MAAAVTQFIDRWSKSAAAERANYQLFLSELRNILGVARPQPQQGDDAKNHYVFERTVTFPEGRTERIKEAFAALGQARKVGERYAAR